MDIQDGDWVDASEILPKHGQIVDIYHTYHNIVSKDSKYYLKPKIVNNLTVGLECEDYQSYICLYNNSPGAGKTFGPQPFYIYENGDFSHWRLVTKPKV